MPIVFRISGTGECARVIHPDSLFSTLEPVAIGSSPVKDQPSENLKTLSLHQLKLKDEPDLNKG